MLTDDGGDRLTQTGEGPFAQDPRTRAGKGNDGRGGAGRRDCREQEQFDRVPEPGGKFPLRHRADMAGRVRGGSDNRRPEGFERLEEVGGGRDSNTDRILVGDVPQGGVPREPQHQGQRPGPEARSQLGGLIRKDDAVGGQLPG